MSPSGIDALRRQRAQNSRQKPPSRHPVGPAANQADAAGSSVVTEPEAQQPDAVHGDAAVTEQAPVVEVSEQTAAADPPTSDSDVESDGKPQVPGKKPRRDTRKGQNTPPPAVSSTESLAPVVGLRGEEERREVAVVALGWAAMVRRLGEREQHLREAIEAAIAAGTPAVLIDAALVEAEAKAGVPVPPQVRAVAASRRRAR